LIQGHLSLHLAISSDYLSLPISVHLLETINLFMNSLFLCFFFGTQWLVSPSLFDIPLDYLCLLILIGFFLFNVASLCSNCILLAIRSLISHFSYYSSLLILYLANNSSLEILSSLSSHLTTYTCLFQCCPAFTDTFCSFCTFLITKFSSIWPIVSSYVYSSV